MLLSSTKYMERKNKAQCAADTSTCTQLNSFVKTWDTMLLVELGEDMQITNTLIGKFEKFVVRRNGERLKVRGPG